MVSGAGRSFFPVNHCNVERSSCWKGRSTKFRCVRKECRVTPLATKRLLAAWPSQRRTFLLPRPLCDLGSLPGREVPHQCRGPQPSQRITRTCRLSQREFLLRVGSAAQGSAWPVAASSSGSPVAETEWNRPSASRVHPFAGSEGKQNSGTWLSEMEAAY